MVRILVNEAMQLERQKHLNAAPFERSPERRGRANGYKPKTVKTRVGAITFDVPQVREGGFYPEALEKGQRSEKALVLALQESYLQGVSTRKVKRITEKLCGVEFSKDQVSSMAQALDEELDGWRTRPLENVYPYMMVDAHYEYVSEDGRVESDGVLLVKGVREDGFREILSVLVAPTEEEATWGTVFADLLERGLDARRVICITSDEHKGLGKAMRRYLPQAIWQRCQTHYQRNAGSKVPAKARDEVHAGLRDVFNAPDEQLAWQRARRLMAGWQNRFPHLVEWLETTLGDALAVFALPKEHRTRLRTNNGLELFHEELRRRSRVVRIFPNRGSCLRLSTALAMEQSEEWLTGHRYLDMTGLEAEPLAVVELPDHEAALA